MKYQLLSLVLCFSVAAFVGCGDATEESNGGDNTESHEGHDHGDEHAHGDEHSHEPETFAEALEEVKEMKTKICKAFSDGTPNDAHDALHDVGHALEGLSKTAGKEADVTPEQLEKVKVQVEALFEGFAKLDGVMHGGPEVKIEDLEKTLTAAITELEGVMK
ncbi:MAG: hypothetical protein VXZ82_15310 [Planctomycetota bacterium]|nr:hypothetical protein [Planctomycetota bacterium]